LKSNILGLKEFLEAVYTNFGVLYNQESPYWSLVNEIFIVHHEVDQLYDIFAANMAKLSTMVREWDRYFSEVRAHLATRDKIRHKYDHYDHKMARVVKRRDKKMMKGKRESDRFVKHFESVNVILKYRPISNLDQLLIVMEGYLAIFISLWLNYLTTKRK
jgi:hypothetical protein